MSRTESDILITRPVSISLLTLLACAVTLAIFLFLYFGQYTQKQRVQGVLVPDKGLVKVYTPQPGTVISVHVHEGDTVEQGQLLYILSSDRVSAGRERTSIEVQKHLASQGKSLQEEGLRQRRIIDENTALARRTVEGLTGQLRDLDQSKKLLDQQLAIAKGSLARYQELAPTGVLSKLQLEEKHIEMLNREARQLDLQRERATLEQKIAVARQELATASLQGKNQLALIERNQETVQQNLLEGESERTIRVTAPAAGVATGVTAKPGQWSAGTAPLMRILPNGASLQAELYAPSNAVSFIKTGSEVLLRYHAFPYQKFGQQRGKVSQVSRVAVPVGELDNGGAGAMPAGTPVYRITVSVPQQFILAYGRRELLQTGMELDADILLDTRHLYEWMVEPLFSITGKI